MPNQGSRIILPTGHSFATSFLSWSHKHIIWSQFLFFLLQHGINQCMLMNFRFRRCAVQSTLWMAPLNLCFNILFYVFVLSLFTRITSALFIYDRRTLLDIGHHCTNLLQDTLSTDPAWPLEILRSTEVNDGRLNNPRRRRKHRGRRAGIRNRLRKRAHSPPLPSILLANVQSLENKMDDLRARISFQRDIRDCNILCLTETVAHADGPGHRCNASLITFRFYGWTEQPRLEKPKVVECASCLTRNGVTPGISPFCRVPARLIWNTSPLSAAHSTCPGSLHRSSLLPSTFHLKQILAWLCPNSTTSSAATSTNTLTLHVSLPGTSTNPTSEKSCQTSTNIYPVQLEDRIHWIIATPSLRMPTKLVHCRLLANQIMSPFFSHRNTNNGSLMNRRWRGK